MEQKKKRTDGMTTEMCETKSRHVRRQAYGPGSAALSFILIPTRARGPRLESVRLPRHIVLISCTLFSLRSPSSSSYGSQSHTTDRASPLGFKTNHAFPRAPRKHTHEPHRDHQVWMRSGLTLLATFARAPCFMSSLKQPMSPFAAPK